LLRDNFVFDSNQTQRPKNEIKRAYFKCHYTASVSDDFGEPFGRLGLGAETGSIKMEKLYC
jgi:hypothetical protein